MKKNGFTLMEVVVTIGIVILLGIAVASTCLIATSNTHKTRTINFAINEMGNMQKMFEQSNLIKAGNLSFEDLQNSISTYYNNEVECVNKDNKLQVKLCFEDDYTIKSSTTNIITINFDYIEHNVVMSANVVKNAESIYSNNNLFSRWVEV